MRRCCISKRPIGLDAVGSATANLAGFYQHFIHHSETVEANSPKRYTREANSSVQASGLEQRRRSRSHPPGLCNECAKPWTRLARAAGQRPSLVSRLSPGTGCSGAGIRRSLAANSASQVQPLHLCAGEVPLAPRCLGGLSLRAAGFCSGPSRASNHRRPYRQKGWPCRQFYLRLADLL